MKQKKKRNQTVNNKFNFDDDYIIGVSNSSITTTTEKKKRKNNTIKKRDNKNKNAKATTNKKSGKSKMNRKKFKIRSRFLKILGVIVLFVGAGCFLCLSPMFNLDEIIVENNKTISSDTITSLSKIELYKNLFLVNKSEAIDNIEKNPYVNSVSISRKLPNKIKITVEEREEKYLDEFAEGKYAIIDGQGYILAVTSELKDLPILVGIQTSTEELINIKNNKTRLCEEDLRKLDIVANIIDTAKNYEVYDVITKIDISKISDIKLVLESEQKIVYLGSCSDLNTRILYMKEILNNEKGIKGEIFINGNLSEDYVFFREAVN